MMITPGLAIYSLMIMVLGISSMIERALKSPWSYQELTNLHEKALKHMPTLQYVQPTPEQLEVMQKFRDKMENLYTEISELPDNRGKSLALTKLEECAMWLNKSLTGNS